MTENVEFCRARRSSAASSETAHAARRDAAGWVRHPCSGPCGPPGHSRCEAGIPAGPPADEPDRGTRYPAPVTGREPGQQDRQGEAYLLGLRLRGRRVVVVGGGTVAARRVPRLLTAGADVVLVSPSVTPALEEIAAHGRIDWRRRAYA